MKKHIQRLFIAALVILLGGVNTAWAAGYTRTLTDDLKVAGYKEKAFYDFQTNTPAVLPTSGDLRYRDGNVWGLHNFGSGTRSATATISVTSGDLLVLQHYSSDVVSTINRGTLNASMTSSVGYQCYDITANADDITFTIARYGGIVAAFVMEKDESASTADYTINYLLNGEGDPVKTVTGIHAVGGNVATDASFFANDVKYFRADGQPESFAIAASGNTFNVNVRLAATYNYSLVSNLGATFASGSGYEGESFRVGYPRYQLSGTTLYEAAVDNKEYRKSVALTEDNTSVTVTYTAKEGTEVVFYKEAEAIDGMTISTAGNIPVRASGAVAATSSEDVPITTLAPGKYKFHVGIFTSNTAYADKTVNFGIGEKTFAAAFTGVNLIEIASEEYTLSASTEIKYLGTSSWNGAQFDYIWIEKTGDYVPELYTVDFNTEINTSSHDFAVATKWKHIVQDYDDYYVGYKWDAAYGENDGGLLVYKQKVGSSSWDESTVYDLLVTPKVSGTIKLKVKAYENASSSTKAFVQLYALNGSATEKGDMLKEFQTEITGYSTGTGEWVELTYDVEEAQRIGIRAQYVYIDEFSADEIDTTPEAALVVSAVMNSAGQTGTNGTNPVFEQQPDGNMKVVLKVTLSNTGDVDFVAGTTENYTLTVGQAAYTSSAKTYYEDAAIAIPEDLAVGETKTFDVEFTVPYLSGYKYWYVKENVTGTTSTSSRYATSVAYESKFILRVAESGSTSDLTTAQDYGRISAAETRSFEIYNDGTAPLVIKSITLPDGFTSDNLPEIPTEGLELAKKTATAAFNVTLPVDVMDDFSGNLVIKYVKAGDTEETTKTLAFSGSVLAEGTWFTDFNGDKSSSSGIVYPAGSIVESSTLISGYTGNYGNYDHYLKSYNRHDGNKFITPLLHATEGATLKFGAIKYQSGNSYAITVYVSTDRQNWGEAKMTVSNADEQFESTDTRYPQTLTFEEEGNYYVAFDVYGMGLDNIIGLNKVDVAHDMFIKTTTLVAEAQTGSTIKPKVTIVPLTDETAESYTVKYYVDGEAVATGEAIALTAKASDTKDFTISYVPTDAVTTEHDTYIEFEFTDGTKIATEHQTLKVTNEPKFLFVAASTSVSQYTTNLTTAQAFGKLNVTTESKSFKIYNQGTATLNVTEITAPNGFSVNKTEAFEVAAGESEEIIVTFSATTPGDYAGNLVVTYVQEGAEPYELAFSGTMLDSNKWYANFNNPTTDVIVWPAGSLYESSIYTTYSGYSAPYNYSIYSRSASNNKFTTPKLTATAGDMFSFDAKAYNSYNDGSVKVYASATRDELGEAIADLTITNTDWSTQQVTITNAGDYYITIEFENAYLDELYGLSLTPVAHDLAIASSSIPTEGMQNINTTATVNVLNFGLADDNATVTVYLDNKAVATSEAQAIPMNHKLSDAGTQLSINFHSPKAGTFPVYLEVKSDDYTLTTEPVDVVFAEEKAKSDADMAVNGTTGEVPLNLNYKNSESVTMYNADALAAAGITPGAVIKKITYKGYKTTDEQTTSFQVYYKWTDDQTLSQPAATYPYAAEDNGMTNLINEDHTWAKVGSSSEMGDMIVLDFTENPITYENGKSLVVYMHSYVDGYKAAYFEKSTLSQDFCYARKADAATLSSAFSKQVPAALHFTLEASTNTFAGTVKNAAGEAIEGATLTLVSRDGENIQYAGMTEADGTFSINVIQSSRDYNVFVIADGYITKKAVALFTDGDFNKDFTMYESPLKNWVNTNLASTEGWTKNHPDGTYWELGNGLIGTYRLTANDNDKVSTVDATHLSTEYAFGMECRWQTNYASYTQESKKELPAGKYTLTFDVENTNASTTKATYENYFKVLVGEQVFTDNSTEWMNGKSNWTEHSITFTVTEPAKATLSFGYGTGSNNIGAANTPALYVSHLAMTVTTEVEFALEELDAEIAKAEGYKTGRTEGLTDYEAAIATAKGFLTSEDADAINDAIKDLQDAETAFLTANLPVAEGTYYVYNSLTEKFLSRGNAYGTAAVVDDYGVAVNVAVTDLANGQYTLSSFDMGANYGFDAWMYADASGNNVRSYTFAAVDGGYTITNTNNSQFVYVYTKEDGNKYRVAGNAIKDDNYTDDAQTVWQFLTKTERDEMVADREAAAKTAAFTAAGVDEDATVDLTDAVTLSLATGQDWTKTIVRTQDNQPATNANGTEMWQATGSLAKTVEGLTSGLYKVSVQAFYRDGDNASVCTTNFETGYNTVLAYLEANGNKVQVKSMADTDGSLPTSMTEAKAQFDADKYISEVYTYVGEDGNLALTLNNPAYIGGGWFIVGNVKYQKVEELVTLAEDAEGVEAKENVTVAVERTFNADWNAVILPFDLSADEVKAAFGENVTVASYVGDVLNGDNVQIRFQTVEAIEAGVPYLVKLEEAKSNLKFYTKTLSDIITPATGTFFDFTGVYTTTTVNEGDYFVQGGKLRKAGLGNTVKPFRSYLEANPDAASVRGISFFLDDNEVTGIKGLLMDGKTAADTYNVSGQKMDGKLRKGVYIQNNKKVVIK